MLMSEVLQQRTLARQKGNATAGNIGADKASGKPYAAELCTKRSNRAGLILPARSNSVACSASTGRLK